MPNRRQFLVRASQSLVASFCVLKGFGSGPTLEEALRQAEGPEISSLVSDKLEDFARGIVAYLKEHEYSLDAVIRRDCERYRSMTDPAFRSPE